jgi:formylglycine-generating enzyme required for sulfatase activity
MKRTLLLMTLAAAASVWAQDVRYPPRGQELPGPPTAADTKAWLDDVRHWRNERLVRIGYNGSLYDRPEFRWTQTNFVQPQVMIEDRYLYDPVARRYTVDRYLNDVEKRYGGVDSVLLWHTYPNIGLDDRNQNDLLRDLPGGVEGVRQMVADFHRRGVRVLFPIMVWDQGTREKGAPDWVATARLFAEIGVDGINGDTLTGVPRAYLEAADAAGHPLVLEPEVGLSTEEMLMWNAMSWGYWEYPRVPGVSRYKWLEPRHMIHICNRWARDKTNDLQAAFFNGIGYESWENIWSIWNQIGERDAEALRRIAKIERRFAPLLTSAAWEPHTPTLRTGAHASKFPGDGQTLWTFVNRNGYDLAGQQITIPRQAGRRYLDLWNGVEIQPAASGDAITLSFPLEANGYGAVLETATVAADLEKFVSEMAVLAKRPLKSFAKEGPILSQTLTEIAPVKAASKPEGMIAIPGGEFRFQVSGVMIEGENNSGVDVQYPWEDSPRRHHVRDMRVSPFFIDRYPVTNAEFKKFMDATHYRPADDHNFLKDWSNGSFPAGWAEKPVTWVSIEDARAYAKWAGKRLPHEWEWQYAAQGSDGRAYPWGAEWNAKVVPEPDKGRKMRGPDAVTAHPQGASPFGVEDLVGNVWQWTEEVSDDHTRSAILRGGSYYQPQGSNWYFPQAYRLDQHGKFLLIGPSKDRSGAVGFRCVVDAG